MAPLPHRPPSPASLAQIALAARSFRAFGAEGEAWRAVRGARRNGDRRGQANDAGENAENGEEMALICDAVRMALREDGGGYGAAGGGLAKVENVALPSHPTGDATAPMAVFHAPLIPCHPDTHAPLEPSSLLQTDEGTGATLYEGNDGFYLGGGEGAAPHFWVRVSVSRAGEGAAAKKYREALFAKRREWGEAEGEVDIDRWAEEDEDLSLLKQRLIDAREMQGNGGEDGPSGPLGYHVEVLLVGPHVADGEAVVAPPSELDRTRLGAGQSNSEPTISMAEWEEAKTGSAFWRDAHAAPQFRGTPGPWERANLRAFGEVVLDVRKALARAEFPAFPEGCRGRTFREAYQLNARLKSGSFATVCRGTHRATGKRVAVKCVLRNGLPPLDDAAIFDEVLILSTLKHGYICPLLDFFEEPEAYYLVMELCCGGDLFDRIGQRKSYTENDARDLCRKLLESLRYCHENSVAHCDLKPKNLLLMSEDDDVQIQLADFGFASRVYEPQSLTKQCGTPFFVAPEVLLRTPYDQQSDMWSCGVMVFLLLGGDLPFSGRNQTELFRSIVMGRYEFAEEGWAHVSPEAKDLVRQLLVTDPSKRPTSKEALASPWMRQRGQMLAKNDLQYTSTRLKGFNARLKLRASMIAVGSVVSLTRMSHRSDKGGQSDKSLSSATRPPSFLQDLPDEGVVDEESTGEEEE
ncbi:hypothetical protein ACHAXT_002668 [Thalassiosira profunda]